MNKETGMKIIISPTLKTILAKKQVMNRAAIILNEALEKGVKVENTTTKEQRPA